MLISENTVVFLFIAFTTAMVLFAVFFIYMLNLFRNRKNQEYAMTYLEKLRWQQALLDEHERFINEISAQLHHKILQHSLLIKHSFQQSFKHLAQDENMVCSYRLLDGLVAEIDYINKTSDLVYLRSHSLEVLIENELLRLKDVKYELDYQHEPDVSKDVKIIIYRIAQEAISNIIRHSNAKNVSVSMLREEEKFVLTINDNGKGMSQEKIYGAVTHGFHNMRSRAAIIDATLDIWSESMAGTIITIQMKDEV